MSFSRAERRRQQRGVTPPPSDTELKGLLADISGQPVQDTLSVLLEVLPGHLQRDLDECVDMMQMAGLSYPNSVEVTRGWAQIHEAMGHRQLGAWLWHQAGEDREFDLPLALREQMRFSQQRGDYAAVLKACSLWQQEDPQDAEPEGTAALARLMLGEEQRALRDSESLWLRRPDSFLAGLRFFQVLTLSGQTRRARALLEELRAWSSQPEPEYQAEFLMWIAGDREMVELWKALNTSRKLTPLLRHYGAVSLSRRGQWTEARKQWRKAIKADPSLRVARENLEKASPEHLSWPFDFWQLVPMTLLVRLMSSEQSTLDQAPELLWRLPLLWERGGPMGQPTAMKTALNDPRNRCGLLLARFMQMGQGWDLLWGRELPEFDVHGEPQVGPGSVLLNEAMGLRQRGQWARAEELYRRFLQDHPKDPIGLNNLAVCLEQRGDRVGYERILRENFTANPDYLFARVAVIGILLREQRLEEAGELAGPLLERARMHLSEFAAVCDIMLKLALFNRDHEAGELWMMAWDEETAHFGKAADGYRPPTYEQTLRLRREVQKALHKSLARVVGDL